MSNCNLFSVWLQLLLMFVTVSLEREENAVFVFNKSLLLTLFETGKGFILNRLTEN